MHIKQYMVILMPMLICEFFWSLGENVYASIYGHVGTNAFAAMTLTNRKRSGENQKECLQYLAAGTEGTATPQGAGHGTLKRPGNRTGISPVLPVSVFIFVL